MKKLMILTWIFILSACSNQVKEDFSLTEHIPENAEIILISPDLKSFVTSLNDNGFLNNSDFHFKNNLKKELGFLPYLNLRNETAIAFSNLKDESFSYSLITKRDSALIPLDSIPNKSIENLKEGSLEYKKINLEDFHFYLKETGNMVLITNSKNKLHIKDNSSKSLHSERFKEVYKAADPNKNSVFINHKFGILNSVIGETGSRSIQKITDWSVVELDVDPSEIKANGISLFDNLIDLPGVLRRSKPGVAETTRVCPSEFISLYAFSFDQPGEPVVPQNGQEADSTKIYTPDLLEHIQEIARVNLPEGSSLVLNAIEIETAKEQLAGTGEQVEEFRGKPVLRLIKKPDIQLALSNMVEIPALNYYTILDHFIIFAPEIEILQKHISSFLNSNSISEQAYFKDMMNSISSESSMLLITRNSAFTERLTAGQTSSSFQLNRNSLTMLQFIMEKDFAHIHAYFSNSEDNSQNSSGPEQFSSVKLDAPLATRPYFFKNHKTDQFDIAVQDEQNRLHLFSNKGNLFWRKELDSKITSDIYQVDLFKNGNQQLAFSTGYNLEVLDRNGNRVKPFPISFNQPLTQPVSVFDYDNNRNYRFVLTQNNRLYMVGPKGKGIKGFQFEKAGSQIAMPPKHIRLGTKDYILVPEKSGRLNILSRQGEIRVPISESIQFSDNQWYGYRDKFVSTAPQGNLLEISQQGQISKKNLDLAENNRLVAGNDLLVYLNENQLSINEKTAELDFGLYTNPQLFEIQGRSLIAITDLQTHKVYLFNSDAELLEGFPVYGNSQVDIANADLDRRLELIVQGEENEIIMYKL
ncbi:hypothetical protein MKO06_07305 [Gramella sp. GC03-9]|uniref:Uncharacterized protein n=1 Tax=Christiangramia oceanisediminis TaxID=2920386 RepID=A0A9X2I2B3_9FLAO|nr:hypothetical protein [Gramella oceanisediminis]MCP9199706.1 hypothetical protein [Gramella oceanisediminis]